MKYLGIDIGGTWIKGALVDQSFFTIDTNDKRGFPIERIESPLSSKASIGDFICTLSELVGKLNCTKGDLAAIGISTAGIVNYSGTQVVKTAKHLENLKDNSWKTELERTFDCKTVLINDADAAAIGLAELGYLAGNKTIGIMPVGTGLGFSVWRNGRRWRPGKAYTLLGSLKAPTGNVDSQASVSALENLENDGDLSKVLSEDSFLERRRQYIRNLSEIIINAAIVYSLDEVIICGGLADAVKASAFPLQDYLQKQLQNAPDELKVPVKAQVAQDGNLLPLLGCMSLAYGESVAKGSVRIPQYTSLETEVPYKDDVHLEKLGTDEIIANLWKAEQESGASLEKSLNKLGSVVDEAVRRIKKGGRIIYVGSGTSGRIAAMDAVEIPCTYGFPEDRIVTLIAGGIADAAIEIESDFEEDASAVPEMLLLNIQSNDSVIGISASGAAYYVYSALAFAKSRGAMTVQILANPPEREIVNSDFTILLHSGNEVVAGSTRMKAGTATKKVLNFLSSTIMIKLEKVAGPYMVDMACINDKLVSRALAILKKLYGLSKEEGMDKLEQATMNLHEAIKIIESNSSSE